MTRVVAQPQPPRVGWGWWLLGATIGALVVASWRLTWWLVRRPLRLVWIVMLVVSGLVYDEHPALLPVVAGLGLATLGVWAWRWPASFRRRVVWRLRGRWRGLAYRRWWAAATGGAGLDARHPSRGRVFPRRSLILASKYADHFRVRMLPGQTIEDWITAGPQLAATLNVSELRIRPAEPGRLQRRSPRLCLDVTAIRRDALAQVVPLAAPPADPDLSALPVARTEDGDDYLLRLLYHHVLIGGATGAGKGSALWSTVLCLGPAIQSGLVRLYGIDPKSLEFPYGAGLFHDVIDGDPDVIAVALERLVEVMNQRKAAMRGNTRLHTPTTAEPMIVVVVDELAALTGYVTVAATKKRIESALALLLSQGRAMAISVVAAAQDPRKEALGQRNLFTTRIGMRLTEAADVDMLMGSGARSHGALCDRIPDSTPGVAYVMRDGDTTATRVRFPWVSDDDIRAAAATYGHREAPVVGPVAVPDNPDDVEPDVIEADPQDGTGTGTGVAA